MHTVPTPVSGVIYLFTEGRGLVYLFGLLQISDVIIAYSDVLTPSDWTELVVSSIGRAEGECRPTPSAVRGPSL